MTALHLAAVSGSLECVRLLLDAGASMMVRTVDLDVMSEVVAPAGSTPLHVAAMTGNVSVLQAMLQVRACKAFADVAAVLLQPAKQSSTAVVADVLHPLCMCSLHA